MENTKFQIFRNSTTYQYYYRLRAKNGEIVLSGEGYTTKQNCQNAIAAVKANAPYDSQYDRKTATNGQYYFTLKASNNQIIGVGETYPSTQAREIGISAVKKDAPGSPTEDLS